MIRDYPFIEQDLTRGVFYLLLLQQETVKYPSSRFQRGHYLSAIGPHAARATLSVGETLP